LVAVAGSATVPLVPKLYLGTSLSAKLCFPQAEATKLRGHLRSQVQLGNEKQAFALVGIAIALSFSLWYVFQMLAKLMEALANKLKPKGTTALEKNQDESNNHFELEKQKREMNHARKLAEYNADREGQRHHFDATITLAGHALKSAILINGGAAVGTLTFIGHELQLPQQFRSTFAQSLLMYASGVLCGAFATGFSYLAQHYFMEKKKNAPCPELKFWSDFAGIAILCAYLFFGAGSFYAYSGFINPGLSEKDIGRTECDAPN
jgi:hypothetical protein